MFLGGCFHESDLSPYDLLEVTPSPIMDYGIISEPPALGILKHVFHVRNMGSKPVRIKKLDSSCSSVRGYTSATIIEPKEIIEIHGELTLGDPNQWSGFINLVGQYEGREFLLQMCMSAIYLPTIYALPADLELKGIPNESQTVSLVVVSPLRGTVASESKPDIDVLRGDHISGFEIVSAETTIMKTVKFKLQDLKEEHPNVDEKELKQRIVQLNLRVDMPSDYGDFATDVRITPGGQEGGEVLVPIRLIVGPPIDCNRESIFFGNVDVPTVRTVNVRCASTRFSFATNFRTIRTEPGGLLKIDAPQLSPDQNEMVFSFASLPSAWPHETLTEGTIIILFDCEGKEYELKLPFSGYRGSNTQDPNQLLDEQ
jgi:hypothetical protein